MFLKLKAWELMFHFLFSLDELPDTLHKTGTTFLQPKLHGRWAHALAQKNLQHVASVCVN